MSQLIALGATRMRLPFWNKHAYAQPNPTGPWAYLYDVNAGIGGGDPIPVLIGWCDEHDAWEPLDA